MACSDMDATYKDLIKDGETTYVGKADSVQVGPGNKRLQLFWWLSADPQVKKVRVFWNNRNDSLEVPVAYKGEPQQMNVIVENLTEGDYTFEMITYDDRGNKSVTTEVQGKVYGDFYTSSLVNRPLLNIDFFDHNVRMILWKDAAQRAIGTELNYVDREGISQTTIVPATEDTTKIPDIMPGSTITYRTLYLPDPLAIDIFYSPLGTKEIPEYALLAKTKFKKYVLPTDNTTTYSASYPIERLWDNNAGTFYHTANNSGVPTWFTFDMGLTAKLGRIRYNQRNTPANVQWADNNPRYFEIWGTADTPNPNGSWDNWTKLMDVESVKPSGLPLGQVTAEDAALAVSGEEFTFPSDVPPVRYIRVKVNGTWGNSQAISIAEFTFWGQ
jgi:hypothetical protein